jgi:5-methylcytosine-specific restriction endonuclease McrA
MRPLTRNPNPGYNIPQTIQINRKSIQQPLMTQGIQPVPGYTATFYVQDLLNFLSAATFANQGTPNWGNPNINANQRFLIPQLISLFTSSGTAGYGNARGALLQNFGEICSYCEMTVQDSSLAVEHILPKAEFPGVMITYTNFFLACPVCNSVKGSQPTYTFAYTWAVSQGIFAPNYNQILAAGVDCATSPTDATSYTGFTPNLYTANNALIPRQNSLNTNNAYISTTNNQVTASINGMGNIIVSNRFASNGNGTPLLRNNNFIAMVGLNRVVVGEFSDRRVTNRTVAWLDALAAAYRLNTVFQNDPSQNKQLYLMMVAQVLATVRTAGYFSTWAEVFYVLSPPLNNQWSYYSFLRNNATDPTQPQYYIPGTNAAALPAQ